MSRPNNVSLVQWIATGGQQIANDIARFSIIWAARADLTVEQRQKFRDAAVISMDESLAKMAEARDELASLSCELVQKPAADGTRPRHKSRVPA